MRRPALLQLLPVTEPPKHAGRYHSGGAAGLHVHIRVSDI